MLFFIATMRLIRFYHAWIAFLVSFLLIDGVISADVSSSENARNERAILGLFSDNDNVGGGTPGRDFPALSEVPRTDFSCRDRAPGYYADEDFGCQVFHICHSDHRKDSFLCPNGTIFHQLRLVCDWWYNVDCTISDLHVAVNNNIGKLTPRHKDNSLSLIDEIDRLTSSRKSNRDFGRSSIDSRSDFDLTSSRRQHNNDVIRESFGVPLQQVSNIRNKGIDDINFQTVARTERPENLLGLQFPATLQAFTRAFASLPPTTTTPSPFITRKQETSPFGVTLRTGNVTPRTSFMTSLSSFSPKTQTNRIFMSEIPKIGVDLPLVANDLNDFRDDAFVLFNANDRLLNSGGIPLPPPIQNFPEAIIPPEHFTVPRPKPPSRVLSNQKDINLRGSGERISNARRVKINKRPITSSIPRTFSGNNQQSRPRNQFQANFNRISNLGDKDFVVLDDDKISTQFFNIGSPRKVNIPPTSTTAGRPLPPVNSQSDNNNRNTDSFGSPLQFSGVRLNNQNNFLRTSFGIPLPPITTTTSNIGTNHFNKVGVSLSETNLRTRNNNIRTNLNTNQLNSQIGVSLSDANRRTGNDLRTNIERPLAAFNRISTGQNNNLGTSFRLSSSRESGNFNQGSRINANRGSTTFLSSQRNRANIQNLLNNQVGRTVPGNQPSTGFIAALDDDILDDLDDLNDPFDDDRFDDDRFDDDRFDDDRFDNDRFDDDRFDLDDRFDDDRFDDDRFDNDRFDDDRFDLDDRIDDDRFELDDRFDDLDDKFDNDRLGKSLFDFDDEIDDRRLRFGNTAGFNFGRRARGSVFPSIQKDSNDITTTFNENPEGNPNEPSSGIEPPSEIQLPPPPL